MKTGNYFLDNADLVTTFDALVPWDVVVPELEGTGANVAETVSTWREALALAGKYVGTDVASRAKTNDEVGVIRAGGRVELNDAMKANVKGLAELGLVGMTFPQQYEGAGLPYVCAVMFAEMLARADPATSVHYGVGYTASFGQIFRFGNDDQKRRYLPRLAKGEISGAIGITEPEAGSDVGNIATTAVKTESCWRLNGRKQFISSGNGDFVIAVARAVPDSKGLDGLALFIVEKDQYAVERAEHKFTIRGSPTCALAFENSRGELLGEIGKGWREITSFINESRIGVGIQGLGIAQAAYEAALEYTGQRVQMGRPIREHPMIAEMLLEMETSIVGLRALAIEAALKQSHLEHAPDERTARELRELTPLIKWFGSEEAIRVARMTLQAHGGYGVVTEYEVDRFMRDSLILPIYEGTSQIQGLMATKDLIKGVLRKPASLLGAGPSAMLARASFQGPGAADFAAARGLFVGTIRGMGAGLVRKAGLEVLRGKAELSDEQIAPFLLHAERIGETMAHLHVARALLEQAKRVPERRRIAARAAKRARLVAERNARRVEAGDLGAFERAVEWQRERTVR